MKLIYFQVSLMGIQVTGVSTADISFIGFMINSDLYF